MLEVLRRSQRWILAAVIGTVGFVFVVFVGVGGPLGGGPANVVVEVDGRRFGPRDVDRVRRIQEEEYRRVLGDAYDASAAGAQLDAIAANILVGQALRAREAEALGLAVSDEELRDHVRRSFPGAADESGRLRAAELTDYAEREFGTEAHFVELLRMDLLARRLHGLFRESLEVSEAEAREALLHRLETVRIAYVALDTRTPRAEPPLDDAALDRFLAEQEPRVRARYEERLDDYEEGEARGVRHILFRVEEGASEEAVGAARGRAEAALERIRAGADFVDVALELSEDAGTRASGGDLGLVEREGQLAAALEAAVFALAPGTVGGPVQSPAGFHLLRVDELRPARTAPFEEVRRDLAREILREEQAAAEARRTAEELAAAVRGGKSLVDAARAAGLTLERTDALHRRPDGYIPGLGAAPEVLTAAFVLRPERPSERIFELRDRLVLIELLERTAPGEDEIAAGLAAERAGLREAELARLPQAWLDQRREELREDGRLFYDLSPLQ
jgi:peptidyl-prolyl cis-trans isomerase D